MSKHIGNLSGEIFISPFFIEWIHQAKEIHQIRRNGISIPKPEALFYIIPDS